MSFSITNSTNVSVLNWSVVQPQFWASIVVNSTNVLYHNYYVNATNFNPDGWNDTLSWIQNTDGADTYRSHNVTFGGFIRSLSITHSPWLSRAPGRSRDALPGRPRPCSP